MEPNAEKTIPVKALKDALNAYDKVYQSNKKALDAYDFKIYEAKSTLLSLLSYLFYFVFIAIFWIVAIVATQSKTVLGTFVAIVCGIIMFLILLLLIISLVYFQSVPNKKVKKIRFRIVYHIACLSKDFKEIKKFREKFNIKASTLALIFGGKMAEEEAYRCLSDWAYGLEYDSILLIDEYKDKFSEYKDYINLDSQWNICGELLEIINSGRADNLKEALTSLDIKNLKEDVDNRLRSLNLEVMRTRDEAASARAEAAKAKRQAESIKIWYW